MVYNAAGKWGYNFSGASGFDVEDLVLDLVLVCQKYKAHKGSEFCIFCNTKYTHVLKHVSIRWVRLEKAVSCTLVMY